MTRAEEAWKRACNCMLDELAVKEIEAYGAECRAQGVREMRDAVPWHEEAFREQVKRIAARILSSSPGVKP
jgi:hypothetical protein